MCVSREVITEQFKKELNEALNEVELIENGLIKKVTFDEFIVELQNIEPVAYEISPPIS